MVFCFAFTLGIVVLLRKNRCTADAIFIFSGIRNRMMDYRFLNRVNFKINPKNTVYKIHIACYNEIKLVAEVLYYACRTRFPR
jgi:hypothetical protein